jgi:hypothetical protein
VALADFPQAAPYIEGIRATLARIGQHSSGCFASLSAIRATSGPEPHAAGCVAAEVAAVESTVVRCHQDGHRAAGERRRSITTLGAVLDP